MAVVLAAVHEKSLKAKVRVYVQDFGSWISIFSEVAGEGDWPMFPKVKQIKKTLFEELSFIKNSYKKLYNTAELAESMTDADLNFMKLYKAELGESKDDDPKVCGDPLTDEWFINERWSLVLDIQWPESGLRACDGHGDDYMKDYPHADGEGGDTWSGWHGDSSTGTKQHGDTWSDEKADSSTGTKTKAESSTKT